MKKGERKMIVAFILPIVLVYLCVFLYPTIRTGYMSFFELSSLSSASDTWKFTNIQNYTGLLKNPLFVISFKNMLKILVIGGGAVFILSLFFANVMVGKFKGKKFWRAMVYLPNIITPIALVTMWTQYIFNNQFGLLKSIFSFLHLDKLAAIPWTSNEMSFWSMLIAFCFGSVGYYMVLFMAAMEQIPLDFYEYASIAGASKRQTFFKITLPLLKDTMKTALTFWSVGAINFFLWARVFSSNPMETSTIVPASYMFSLVFGAAQSSSANAAIKVGSGAAIGVIITLCVILVYTVVNLIMGKEKYEY